MDLLDGTTQPRSEQPLRGSCCPPTPQNDAFSSLEGNIPPRNKTGLNSASKHGSIPVLNPGRALLWLRGKSVMEISPNGC